MESLYSLVTPTIIQLEKKKQKNLEKETEKWDWFVRRHALKLIRQRLSDETGEEMKIML